MSDEPSKEVALVTRETLGENPTGNYYISQQEIDDYDMSFWVMFAKAYHKLQAENPNTLFELEDHRNGVLDGITIKWRPADGYNVGGTDQDEADGAGLRS